MSEPQAWGENKKGEKKLSQTCIWGPFFSLAVQTIIHIFES